MSETVVIVNLPEMIEEMKFRKAINALGTYKSEEEYVDAMMAITERDMADDPLFPR